MIKNPNNKELNSLNDDNKQKFKTLALEIPMLKTYVDKGNFANVDIFDMLSYATVYSDLDQKDKLEKLLPMFGYKLLYFEPRTEFDNKTMRLQSRVSDKNYNDLEIIKTTKFGFKTPYDIVKAAVILNKT